jgi:hypothetical protein
VGKGKMNEVIENVLNNDAYTTNEERVEAIKQGLATLVMPKDKYNDLANKLKTSENNFNVLKNEYDEFKQSKMTADEKIAEEKKQFELDKKANAIEKSSLGVQKLLLKNGIEVKDDDEELKATLENIISEDYDKSISLANSFISLLNKTKDKTVKETTTQLLNDTPKPIGGTDSTPSVSKIDSLKQQLDEAIKSKDVVLQAQLTTEIFQEQQRIVK